MNIFTAAFSLFLIMNALGNLPFFLSLLKTYPESKQRKILVREMFFALLILLCFGFFGDSIIRFLGITEGVLGIAGGLLLLIIGLTMVFPNPSIEKSSPSPHEPMLVPIAIPGMAGPGGISTVMLYSSEFPSSWTLVSVILMAWSLSLVILSIAPQIKRVVGDRGLIAFERFGGLLMCLISIQLIVSGVIKQVKTNFVCEEIILEKPKQ